MADAFTIKIVRPRIAESRYYDCDIECAACGRPLKDRWRATVVVYRGLNEKGESIFLPLEGNADFRSDPVEWANWVGSHCAKKIPKTHKISMKAACKNVEWC